MKRPSPSESATLFKIGTVKKGNDGKEWIVSATSNGIKRWKRVSLSSPSRGKGRNYINFPLKAITSFKHFGFIEFESKILGGEEINITLPLPKGRYEVYFINGDSLSIIQSEYLSVSKKISKSFFRELEWKFYSDTPAAESGMFGFFDSGKLKKINAILGEKPTSFPINADTFSRNITLLNSNGIEDELPEKLENLVYGVASTNGSGDGQESVYLSFGHPKDISHSKAIGAFFPGYSLRQYFSE